MFERFTGRAREAVVQAQVEARVLQHDRIGTEHLLLGLLRNATDLPARLLARHGVDLEVARREVREITGEHHAATGHIPFTPRAKTVMEISLREALELGHDQIGTGHLVLAVIREGRGGAHQVLTRLGTDLEKVEHDVLQQLAGEFGATAKTVRRPVRPVSSATRDLPPAGVAARLDSIDERLTEITQRLEAIEQRLTDS